MPLPSHSPYVIIGAGIHGLSTAYHLAMELKAKGNGSGRDILVIDKTSICAGATGIACGVVRNNYYQPAMRELMAVLVSGKVIQRHTAINLWVICKSARRACTKILSRFMSNKNQLAIHQN